jgi:biotin carboxylase
VVTAEAVLLLLGSGRRAYREYLLQGLAGHAPLWLIDDQEPTWQRRYLVGSSLVAPLDDAGIVADQDGLTAAALAVAADRKIAGVVTYDELQVTAAAHVAEQLGVRGLTAAGAQNCRDKARTRAALTAAGVPQPGFAVAHDLAQALAAAQRIGYPVVVKPRGMGMSVGVTQADGPAELVAAFELAVRACASGPPSYADGVLIEERVDGPEISVDGAVCDGEYRPFCLARKQLGAPPHFEEIGHVVDAADPLFGDPALRAVLSDAHTALGLLDGVTHTELRLTANGPVIIEVNARLGGDLIPYLGKLATGIDPGRVAAQVATGARPGLEAGERACAAIRFLYPPQDCRVLGVTVPPPAAVPGLHEARAMAEPGTQLRIPPAAHLGRHAYLLAVASDPEGCAAALDAATAHVQLRYEPLLETDRLAARPW